MMMPNRLRDLRYVSAIHDEIKNSQSELPNAAADFAAYKVQQAQNIIAAYRNLTSDWDTALSFKSPETTQSRERILRGLNFLEISVNNYESSYQSWLNISTQFTVTLPANGTIVRFVTKFGGRSWDNEYYLEIRFDSTQVSLPISRSGQLADMRHPRPNGPDRSVTTENVIFEDGNENKTAKKSSLQRLHQLMASGGIEPFEGLLHFLAVIGTAAESVCLDDVLPTKGKQAFSVTAEESDLINARGWTLVEPQSPAAPPKTLPIGSFDFYASAMEFRVDSSTAAGSHAPIARHDHEEAVREQSPADPSPDGLDRLSSVPDDVLKHVFRFIFPVGSLRRLSRLNRRFHKFLSPTLLAMFNIQQNEQLFANCRESAQNSHSLVLKTLQNAMNRPTVSLQVLNDELSGMAEKETAYDDFKSVLASIDKGSSIPAGRRELVALDGILPEAQRLFRNSKVDFVDAFMHNRTDYETYNIEQSLLFSIQLPENAATSQAAQTLFVRSHFECYGRRGDESDSFSLEFAINDPSQLLLRNFYSSVADADRLLRDDHFSIDQALLIGAPTFVEAQPKKRVAARGKWSRADSGVHELCRGTKQNKDGLNLLLETFKQHGFDLTEPPSAVPTFHRGGLPKILLLLGRIGLALDPSYFVYIST